MTGQGIASRLLLAVSIVHGTAGAAQLSIQLSDATGRPIRGAQITLTGPASLALTDVAGKATIEYQPTSGPLAFKIVRPAGLVIVSPWQGSTSVPPNSQAIVAATQAQMAALQSPVVVKAAVAKVNELQRPRSVTAQQENNAPPEYYLNRAAGELGIDPANLERVIQQLQKSSPEPYERGMASLYNRDYEAAVARLTEALRKAQQQKPVNLREVASAATFLGQAYFHQGKFAPAAAAYYTASQARPDDPVLLNNLGISLSRAGLYNEARPVYRRAIDILRSQPDADPLEAQTATGNLAALHIYAGDYAAAEPILRRVVNIGESLSPNDPAVATGLNNLAALLLAQQKCAEARPLLEKAVRIQRAASAGQAGRGSKGIAVLESQAPPPAPSLQSRSVTVQGAGIGPGTPGLNSTMVNLASLLLCEGKTDAARDVIEDTLERQRAQLGPAHPDLATPLNILAQTHQASGDLPAAEQAFRQALQIQRASLAAGHPALALTEINLAGLLVRTNRAGGARALYEEAEQILVKSFGEKSAPVERVREQIAKLSAR